jgi:hypothetical protein
MLLPVLLVMPLLPPLLPLLLLSRMLVPTLLLLWLVLLLLQIFSEPDDGAFVSVFQRLGGGSDGQDQTMTRGTVLALLQRYGLTAQDSWSKERRRAHKRRVKAATQLLDAVPMQAFMD